MKSPIILVTASCGSTCSRQWQRQPTSAPHGGLRPAAPTTAAARCDRCHCMHWMVALLPPKLVHRPTSYANYSGRCELRRSRHGWPVLPPAVAAVPPPRSRWRQSWRWCYHSCPAREAICTACMTQSSHAAPLLAARWWGWTAACRGAASKPAHALALTSTDQNPAPNQFRAAPPQAKRMCTAAGSTPAHLRLARPFRPIPRRL